MPCFFLNQLRKEGEAFSNFLEADAVAQSEIAGTAEIVTGHDQKILFLCLFGEGLGIAAGGFYEKIERAIGLCHPVTGSDQAFV